MSEDLDVWPFWRDGDEECLVEERALAILLRNEVLFANSRQYVELDFGRDVPLEKRVREETIVLFVICNDIFAWGCADAESITTDQIEDLFRLWHADKPWGAAKWCCKKRNMKPQDPVIDAMKAAGSWNDAMELLPDNPCTIALKSRLLPRPTTEAE